jgi:hypothetical protein
MMLYDNCRSIGTLLAALAFGLVAQQATATDIHVCAAGCPHSTIQGGVNAAASGDRILIHPDHRYVETVTIQGKSLSLFSSSVAGIGSGNVDVAGPGRGPVFVLGSGTATTTYEHVTLGSMTISGGSHFGGTGVGGGVQVRQGAYLTMYSSTVTRNYASRGGGVGINTPGGPASALINCSITGNEASSGGGVYVAQNSNAIINESTISQNLASDGGGVLSESTSTLSADHTSVSGNHVHGSCDRGPTGTQRNCAGGTGGGLWVGSQLTLTDSTITLNSSDAEGSARGGGLYIVLGANQTLTRTVINENSIFGDLYGAGGAIFAASTNPAALLTLTNVYVVNNSDDSNPSSNSAGIFNQGTLSLSHATIADNVPGNCMGGTGCPP